MCQIGGLDVACLEPTVSGDLPRPGVDSQSKAVREAAAHSAEPPLFAQSAGPDHKPLEPQVEEAQDRLFIADPASQTAKQSRLLDDSADCLKIRRPAFTGSIEVDQVQSLRAMILPVQGHG